MLRGVALVEDSQTEEPASGLLSLTKIVQGWGYSSIGMVSNDQGKAQGSIASTLMKEKFYL